jgi:hypothetical protein
MFSKKQYPPITDPQSSPFKVPESDKLLIAFGSLNIAVYRVGRGLIQNIHVRITPKVSRISGANINIF